MAEKGLTTETTAAATQWTDADDRLLADMKAADESWAEAPEREQTAALSNAKRRREDGDASPLPPSTPAEPAPDDIETIKREREITPSEMAGSGY